MPLPQESQTVPGEVLGKNNPLRLAGRASDLVDRFSLVPLCLQMIRSARITAHSETTFTRFFVSLMVSGQGGPLTMKKNHVPTKRSIPTTLPLPDLDHAKSAVLNSLSCPDAQRGYAHAIDEFIDWFCSEPRPSFNKSVVLRYRMHLETRKLAPGTIQPSVGGGPSSGLRSGRLWPAESGLGGRDPSS